MIAEHRFILKSVIFSILQLVPEPSENVLFIPQFFWISAAYNDFKVYISHKKVYINEVINIQELLFNVLFLS